MTMKSSIRRSVVFALLLILATSLQAQDKSIPKSLVKFTEDKLAVIGKDPTLVGYVEKDNLTPSTVAKLKEIDAKWAAGSGIEDFIKAMLANPVSAQLKKLIQGYPYILEAFIMNAQGTIIGETNRTSTYYKGEAAKFTGAYKAGVGALWYGPVEYDASVKINALQVSVPVVKNGKAIGAICFTFSLEEWEKR